MPSEQSSQRLRKALVGFGCATVVQDPYICCMSAPGSRVLRGCKPSLRAGTNTTGCRLSAVQHARGFCCHRLRSQLSVVYKATDLVVCSDLT